MFRIHTEFCGELGDFMVKSSDDQTGSMKYSSITKQRQIKSASYAPSSLRTLSLGPSSVLCINAMLKRKVIFMWMLEFNMF